MFLKTKKDCGDPSRLLPVSSGSPTRLLPRAGGACCLCTALSSAVRTAYVAVEILTTLRKMMGLLLCGCWFSFDVVAVAGTDLYYSNSGLYHREVYLVPGRRILRRHILSHRCKPGGCRLDCCCCCCIAVGFTFWRGLTRAQGDIVRHHVSPNQCL